MECASSYLPKAIFQSYHAEKEDIFPYERLHRSLIYYSLPTKASVWLKTTAIFHSLAISGEKGNSSKVKMTLRRHSSPRVHDGNCWQKKVTVTVKDLSIKTWCLLHLRKASIWFVTDDQNLLCRSPPSISTGLGSRRCERWQIKSLKKVSLLGQIRPSPSCASLSCVPKALRVRGALKAAQRRWRSKHHIAGARAPRVAEKSRTSSRHSYLLSQLSRYPSCWPPQITITSGWSRYPTITSSITILHHQLQ